MAKPIIEVENLSKCYQIGAMREPYLSLRDELAKKARRISSAFFRIVFKAQIQPSNSETDFWALNDVSFSVQEGEAVGIIGRNGAGKSTLLKILSQITPPTKGQITMRGRVASLLEVGTGFHPELTGRENIYLNGAILGMARAEIKRKFDEIVAFAEVEKFLDTPVKRYSSGMYVRLAFAVAAHLEPEILVVDEVLAVGDAQFQKKCLGKMGDVAKEGRTVLFVSHNMVAVQTLCQRAFWLDAGRLKAEGGVSQIVTTYLRSGLAEDDATERVWPDAGSAPGNETVRLHRIAVQPEDGKPGDVITMQTPVRIEVDYWNLLPAVHLHATLHVCNDQGIIAFTTGAGVHPDPVFHIQPPTGLFRSICHIPGNLLNSGFHRVNLWLVRGNMAATYWLDEAIGFEVVDNNERTFGWYGKEPGVLSPQLSWETKCLSPGVDYNPQPIPDGHQALTLE
jgi:lipopolysaccharide transport system ATP-binding protein